MNPSSRRFLVPLVFALLWWTLPLLSSEPLTFEERIAAQEAIERIYCEHRIWPDVNPGSKPTFEEMVPRSVIEAKVTDYLKKSAALEKYWSRPIQAEQLQAEMDRMARSTRHPQGLHELFEALSHDPLLSAECLARPILSDRLIRNWYAYDDRFHGDRRREAGALRSLLVPENFEILGGKRYRKERIECDDTKSSLPLTEEEPRLFRVSAAEFQRISHRLPPQGQISAVQETREAFVIRMTVVRSPSLFVIGTITIPKVPFDDWWMQTRASLPDDCTMDSMGDYVLIGAGGRTPPSNEGLWVNSPSLHFPCPGGSGQHTAIWTGSEMIVWGGGKYSLDFCRKNNGGRYLSESPLPGDCDDSGQVTIGEVQSAVNMFLLSVPSGCGVDYDRNGEITVSELQTIINAFLSTR